MINLLKNYIAGSIASYMDIEKPEMNKLTNQAGFVTNRTPTEQIESLINNLRPIREPESNMIRLGPDGDGGYLLPDDLENITACYSPGVAEVSGFEKECAERGMNVYLADKSVDMPAEYHELFDFRKKFVGASTNDEFMTLDGWVSSTTPDAESDLLLQIDIEGFEYETFLRTSNKLMERFRIIVAEFHSLEQLWNKPFFDITSRVFSKILQTHHVVHLHPNNIGRIWEKDGLRIPSIMEFTFHRKDRVKNPSPVMSFPHSLDFDNTDKPSMVLPTCWYN